MVKHYTQHDQHDINELKTKQSDKWLTYYDDTKKTNVTTFKNSKYTNKYMINSTRDMLTQINLFINLLRLGLF